MKIKSIVEASMAPSAFKKFMSSPTSNGIRAGFEAEICIPDPFTQLNVDPPKTGIDYTHDEEFTNLSNAHKWADKHFSASTAKKFKRNVQQALDTDRQTYIEMQWNGDARIAVVEYMIANKLTPKLLKQVKELLSVNYNFSPSKIEQSIKNKSDKFIDVCYYLFNDIHDIESIISNSNDPIYKEAYKKYISTFVTPSDEEILKYTVESMSSLCKKANVKWPYLASLTLSYNENFFNIKLADALSKTLSAKIGSPVIASKQYGKAKRTETSWIIEPDNSIEPEDGSLAVEVISPPMELSSFFKKLELFINWANQYKTYTNETTGFHVGVSLPPAAGKLDYIKLVLFLNDEHILKQFNREANVFCKKASTDIYQHLHDSYDVDLTGEEKLEKVFDLLKKGCYEIASSALLSSNTTKYTSINVKSDYVEFRMAGGKGYLDNISSLSNMVIRYAYAMAIASDPTAFKEEYATKLYKFLNNGMPTKKSSMDMIADYVSGNLSKEDLKKYYKSKKENGALKK